MVSFRRWTLALTVLALFAGLASAQIVGTSNPTMTCTTNVTVTPTLRGEGFTEQTGDITLVCTGGAIMTAGNTIPTVNIAVSLNTAVTSRLLSGNVSEALLLIDEPGSGLQSAAGTNPGTGTPWPYGPAAPVNVCPFPTNPLGNSSIPSLTNCLETAQTLTVTGGSPLLTMVPPITQILVPNNFGAPGTSGYNAFEGVVSGNTVTFFGVPVLPPATAGLSRVFRITNIRANATTLATGSVGGPGQVVASISITGATAPGLTQPYPIVGFVQMGLTAKTSSVTSLAQCNSQTLTRVNTLTYSENFATAFKTRVAATSTGSYSGQMSSIQNIPGQVYFSESNFVQPVPISTGSALAGLADYGTRLQANFSGIPAGVSLFVDNTNGVNALPGGSASNNTTTSYVQLVTSSTISDGTPSGGVFGPALAPTTGTFTQIQVNADGTATAVWEVLNTNPNALESFSVGVYVSYTANVAQGIPATNTTPMVTMSYAPTYTGGSAAAASGTLTIPRFVTSTTWQGNIFRINICRTVLLYPYITNTSGYDTGYAISNTSMDPFGTGNQQGTCSLNFYQGTNNPTPIATPVIAAGTTWANLASIQVPNFGSGGPTGAGYMIAVCNFQFAHGFAVVQDLGGRNFGMSYLALVVPDPGSGTRQPLSTDKIAGATGEQLVN